MGQPILLVIPKILNVVAGSVVLGLLLWRWFPLAVKERGRVEQRANDLETLAAIDFLTGVYNRRQFETLARAELGRCQRYMRPLSVLMIDIDHFKAVNDQYGHVAGDRVLQGVAHICCAAKRDPDIIARIGGEEFAMMLPETTDSAALEFAERVREMIQDCPATVNGKTIPITVSVGIAGANARTSGIETLMRNADQALYEAKRLGRDRVVIAKPRGPDDVREAAE